MQYNAKTSKLKALYESLDQLKESGEDVVAEIRKEINNIELQYLKEDVLPELMKTLSHNISWLRCSADISLQFDGKGQIDYSFCKSGSTLFVRDKYECEFHDKDYKDNIHENYTEEPSQVTSVTAIIPSVKYGRNQIRAVVFNNIKCTLEGFRTFLYTLKNNHGRSYSPSSINVYCTATRSNYMRSKVLKYHHSGYLYNLIDLRTLSQLCDDVRADFNAKETNSATLQAVRLYIQFIEKYFSGKFHLKTEYSHPV